MKDIKITISGAAGAELTLSHDSVCRLLDGGLYGFDFPENGDSVVDYAFGDGGFAGEKRLLPRRLALIYEITDPSREAEMRDTALRLANPHGDCVISASLYGRTRTIHAYPYGTSEWKQENMFTPPVVRLSFIAPDPFFESETEKSVSLPSSPSSLGGRRGISVENGGDVSCGFEATLCAEDGDVTSPYIFLGPDTLSLTGTLLEGESVTVDTRRGRKGVSLDGRSIISFSKNSSFFDLPAGDAYFGIGAGEGCGNASLKITYHEKFLGV